MSNKIEITLITSNKTGILASIMMTCFKQGLMVEKNSTAKIDDKNSRLTIYFNGDLKCDEDLLISEVESHPEIHAVESLRFNNNRVIQEKPKVPKSINYEKAPNNNIPTLWAHDLISEESLEIAEEKLMQTLGPVAPMLIKSALRETKHIGDLFLLLSKQLEEEEQKRFLSLVSGLHFDS